MMRLIPHSVVVCTSRSGSASRGITVSSFNSLSLEPPIVTFHVATPSRTLDAIRASGRLNIHILTGDVEGAKIAHHFAGNVAAGRPFQEEDLLAAGVRQVVTEDEEDVPVGPPMLSGPGVLYVLSCKLYDKEHNGIVTVSDHAIVLGEILDIGMGNTVPGRHDNFGLVYADRHYRQLGSTLARTPKR
jgi:flavin reductase (DIM6/NTAB) family NADH-FMN oxidoreductase RutF